MNSRQKAKEWPYPRHKQFSRKLRAAAMSWFQEKGFPTHSRMPYCLARWDDWKSNIILPEVAEYISNCNAKAQQDGVPFPLHKYLHHGMSSQAMAFNLIGPLITRNDYSPLVSILKSKNVPGAEDVVEAVFEYEDREVFNEDTGQPTSIDVVLKGLNGQPLVFIESKFDEQEFGGCSVFSAGDCSGLNPIGKEDACFLHFIGRKYWKIMKKHGVSDLLQHEKQCVFTAHYQFFREVFLSLEKNGIFVLLSDDRSPVFHCRTGSFEKGLMPFLTSLLPETVRNSVVSISSQELIAETERHPKHQDWVTEFKRKYAMA